MATIASANDLADYYLDLLADLLGDACMGQGCKTTDGTFLAINPYDQEISGIISYEMFCESCYQESENDI